MSTEAPVGPRWDIARCFVAIGDRRYGCRDSDIEGLNGYRCCFGQILNG